MEPSPPAPEIRPRSTLAVWALAVSALVAIVATFSGFLWIALVPAAVLAAFALIRTRSPALRGQGMALSALLIAVLGGSCQYMGATKTRDTAEHLGTGVLAALMGEDPERIDDWLLPTAREDGAADRIRARFDLLVEEVGPARGTVASGSNLLGVLPILFPPSGVRSIQPEGEARRSPRPGGLWIEAPFERGVVHVELLLGDQMASAFEKVAEEPGRTAAVLEDVHFYVPDTPASAAR